MKKILTVLLISLFLFMPFGVNAKEKLKSQNLKETFKSENIEIKDKKYKENDKKVNIYMFRGQGCTFCRNFLNFLNDNLEKNGKYFNLVSFEIWQNTANRDLAMEVAELEDQQFGGVPYIIVGNKHFRGFTEETGKAIMEEVKEEYERKEKSDILKIIEVERTKKRVNTFIGSGIFTISLFIIVLIVLFISLFRLNKVIVYLNTEIDTLRTKVVELENKQTKEENKVKEEVKEIKKEENKTKKKKNKTKKED